MYQEKKGGYSQQQRRESEIDKVIEKINKMSNLEQLNIKDFAAEGGNADKIAEDLRNLNTTQLRKFFNAAKDIEKALKKSSWSDIEAKFYTLQPLLAYAQGRGVIPRDFFRLIMTCMSKIPVGDDDQKKKNYERFMRFFESIVAYHKYHYPRAG